ncbi:hypothetical protein ACUY1T_11710 [Billgrantia sp. Q4P2]|uniref:hypothetical protein n=1 Tax=Billgrantia sp. Q4P2 TaxID=3463857 RepID=UPI004057569F
MICINVVGVVHRHTGFVGTPSLRTARTLGKKGHISMSLYGLHRSLFSRLPGILLLWLLAWSVGVAYACSPQVELGEPVSQATLAAADESPSLHPESCDDHSPGITASVGKMQADELHNMSATAGLPLDLLSFPLLLAALGEALRLSSLSPYTSSPVYLATARLRI